MVAWYRRFVANSPAGEPAHEIGATMWGELKGNCTLHWMESLLDAPLLNLKPRRVR